MKITLMKHMLTGSEPPPGKSFTWLGKLEPDFNGYYVHLQATKVDVDLKGLAKLMRGMDGNSHLVAGVAAMDVVDVMPAGAVVPDNIVVIPRTNESFPFAIGEPGLMVIDSDGMAGPQVWLQITNAVPALAGHARVETSSSSSNIYAPDGSELKGEQGQHIYLQAADASDIPRALRTLHKRLVMAGHGNYKVSATGDILERSAVDRQMAVSSQPIYVHPTLYGGLTQKKRIDFHKGAEVIDTRAAIPDLTWEEEQAFAKADAAVKAALKGEADAVAAAYDEERGKKLPGGAAEARTARESKRLPDNWIVVLSDGRAVTVADILANKADYHGKTCRDPMEPDYGSKTVAKIYVEQDAPIINSHAHGGRSFHLGEVDVGAMFGAAGAEQSGAGPRPIMRAMVRRPFPLSALPPLVAAACMDVQYHVRCPMALVVGSALSAMSLAAMGHVDAMRSANLVGPCGLIVVEIADASERKTSTDKWFTAAMRAHEVEREQNYQSSLIWFEREMDIWKVKEAAAKRVQKNDGTPATPAEVEAKYRAFRMSNPKPEKPVRQKMLYNTVTAEVMYAGIGRWPLMGILTNEGGTFFGSRAMSAETSMASLAFINALWDGEQITKDTKGNGEDFCANPRGTAHLMAQDGIFRTFLEANGGQSREIGTVARALLCQPETTRGTRFYREDGGTFGIDTFNSRISELLRRPVYLDEKGVLTTTPMHLSPEAKAVWVEYYDNVERQIAPGGRYSGIPDIAGKSPENAARLATVFAYTVGDGVVSADTMRGACIVAEWYLDETLIYLGDDVEPEIVKDTKAVEHCIMTRCIAERADFTTVKKVKDYVASRSLRRNQGRIDNALKLLLDKRRIRVETLNNSVRIYPNPELLVDARNVIEKV